MHYLSRYKLFLYLTSTQMTKTKVYWISDRFFALVLSLSDNTSFPKNPGLVRFTTCS